MQFTRVSDGAEIVGVNARSDEEADLGRQAVLDIYAERARERGAWGFRIGEYWRIVSHDTVFEWQGEEWPEGMADYVFNGRSFYMLEVDYLAEAPAEIDEFTFQAAE